jgi:hypothetical protein
MLPERIAIFHPEGNIANNPHLLAFVRALHQKGYKVDVLSKYQAVNPYQQTGQDSYNLFLLPKTSDFPLFFNSYAFIFGVDDGIIAAKAQADFLDVMYAHISYELFFDDEINTNMINTHYQSKIAAQGACFSILQDSQRATLYSDEYNVPLSSIYIMPAAGNGIISYCKSDYLHRIFNLHSDTRILLHMGSIASWTMVDWLVSMAYTMPENWVLVIHGRYGNKESGKIVAKRVYVTDTAIADFSDLKQLIQSASCCAAMYQPDPGSIYTGKNIQYIGLASGKFSTALQHGIPVLVRSGSMMGDLVNMYHAGVVCSPEQGDTLDILTKLPSELEAPFNCYNLFSDKLDLYKFMPLVFTLLKHLKKFPHTMKA